LHQLLDIGNPIGAGAFSNGQPFVATFILFSLNMAERQALPQWI